VSEYKVDMGFGIGRMLWTYCLVIASELFRLHMNLIHLLVIVYMINMRALNMTILSIYR